MKEKKKLGFLFGILIVATIFTIGLTYAVWQIILKQTGENIIVTGCFEIKFTDDNPINIGSAYPITEEEGRKLTPYEFTIENKCEGNANYQVNLEILASTTLNALENIRVMFQEKEVLESSEVLTENKVVQKTLENALTAYQLQTGVIEGNSSKTFNLRMWLDENTPATNEVMNKIFHSKIIVTTAQKDNGSNEDPGDEGTNNKEIMTENINYIKNYVTEGELLEDDETEDHNMRFIGANPNNYIDIGDRDENGNVILWQIIGIMNNIKSSEAEEIGDARIKVIRNESIGIYSWDSSAYNSASHTGINLGNGVNEWSQADLMKLLNPGYENENVGGSLYWNSSKGSCYNDYNNAKTACDFTNSGLSDTAKQFIEDAVWNLGSPTLNNYNDLFVNSTYEIERGNSTGGLCTSTLSAECTDTVERRTTWTGKVGLMYPSDYGYATSGGNEEDRNNCINSTKLTIYAQRYVCKGNDWLLKKQGQWTLMPNTDTHGAYYIYSIGSLSNGNTCDKYSVFPAAYLSKDAILSHGDGTKENPFVVTMG